MRSDMVYCLHAYRFEQYISRLLIPWILSHSLTPCADLCREEERHRRFDPTTEETLLKERKSYAKQSRDGTSRRFTNLFCKRISSGHLTHQQVPTMEACGKDALGL